MAFFVFDNDIIKLAIAQTRLALPDGEAERSRSPVFEILETSKRFLLIYSSLANAHSNVPQDGYARMQPLKIISQKISGKISCNSHSNTTNSVANRLYPRFIVENPVTSP